MLIALMLAACFMLVNIYIKALSVTRCGKIIFKSLSDVHTERFVKMNVLCPEIPGK